MNSRNASKDRNPEFLSPKSASLSAISAGWGDAVRLLCGCTVKELRLGPGKLRVVLEDRVAWYAAKYHATSLDYGLSASCLA